MLFRSSKRFINDVKKEMKQMDEEYNQMAEENKIRSVRIRKSIQQKSTDFKERKNKKRKDFDLIRNK